MTDRYAWVQRILHWLIAVMILGLFIAGSYMSDIGFGPGVSKADAAFRDFLYGAHKSAGALLLALIALRLFFRMIFGAPPPPALPPMQALAASLAHIGLYALMIATPLLGWLATSSGGFLTLKPIVDAELPALVEKGWMPAKQLFELHGLAATALVALAALHAAAGLYHLSRGDGVFTRMWFGRTAR